jgi:hypothetical protein
MATEVGTGGCRIYTALASTHSSKSAACRAQKTTAAFVVDVKCGDGVTSSAAPMTASERATTRTGPIRVAIRIGTLVGAAVLSGCGFGGYDSDFPVAVGNRTSSTITVFINAKQVGNVGAGETGSFTVRLRESGTYVSSDSPVARVTFSARQLTTGRLSISKPAILPQDPPIQVDFTEADFAEVPTGPSAPIVADFTFSPVDPTISRGTNTVFFDAASSSAATWTWDFGDGSTAIGQHVTHTYLREGTWVVRLTVIDPLGRSATTTKNVMVR